MSDGLLQDVSVEDIEAMKQSNQKENLNESSYTTLTTLLLFFVILTSCFSMLGCIDEHEGDDPFNQAAYGPVAANSREPVDLPVFADPSFDRLVAQFMIDVANKIDGEVMRNRKREVIDNPDLLWRPGYRVPEGVYYDPDLILVEPFKDKIKILPRALKGQPISERVFGYMGMDGETELPFTGKIYEGVNQIMMRK